MVQPLQERWNPRCLRDRRLRSSLTRRPSRVIASISRPLSAITCGLGAMPLFSSRRISERNRIVRSPGFRWAWPGAHPPSGGRRTGGVPIGRTQRPIVAAFASVRDPG